MKPLSNHARAGFTLLEVLLVTVMVGILLGATAMVMSSTRDAIETGNTAREMEQQGRRTMQRIKGLLQAAGETDLSPKVVAPFTSASVSYQRLLDRDGSTPAWGAPERIQFRYAPGEIDDGIDNDGNGLIDDGVVVWIKNPGGLDEEEVVLATRVSELLQGETANLADDNGNGLTDETGLSFDWDGSSATVRMTLQWPDPNGAPLMRTFETTIHSRN